MKRLFLLLAVIQILAIGTTEMFAQKLKPTEVPDDVVQALDMQYSYAKVTSWFKEGNQYIATIKDEGSTGKVYISSTGEWLRTTFAVPQNELPSSITAYVKENYPEFIIEESCLEEKDNEKTHYYLEVKPDGVGFKPSKLTFSTTGTNELISRVDPEDFKDPKAPVEKPAPVKPAEKDNKQTAANTKPATKPTANKPAESKPAPKPATQKPAPAPKPEKQAEPKPEKPKKEKPEPVIKDEYGNIAIKASEVPAVVTKALAKKVMHPEELNWFFIDSTYVARCINTGKKTAVYITKDGLWDKTLTVLPEESVTGPMLKHLNDYYKGFKFKSAVKEQRADKQDKTMVEFYEKANYKAKLVTTIIFDKTGKLIRTIDPDYELGGGGAKASDEDEALEKYYEKMNMSVKEDDTQRVPESVKAAFKLKYPRVTNVEWQEDDNLNFQAIYYTARGKEICVFNPYGEIVETWIMGKPDALSATIQDYLKKEHKGCKVVEYYTVKKIADKQTLYKVLIQDKKSGMEDELWFSLNGKPVEM
ncbi:MAG: PepSY-like domain-containing protein [Bacteroidales bacterium]|nr:PepSY-like domain-containing protein [Bacteroidales bacterium]